MTRTLDRVPPHSTEAEQGVIGCILLDPSNCLDACLTKLSASGEAFYDLRHRTLFESMVEMQAGGRIVDPITLAENLKARNMLAQVGGLAYIMSLPNTVPSAANLPSYLDIVLEKHTLREILTACATVTQRIYDEKGDKAAGSVLDEFESKALGIRKHDHGTFTQADLVAPALQEIEDRMKSGGIVGVRSGFPDLDRTIGGFSAGDLIVLAGFPGTGKTALLGNIVQNCGVPCGVFSLEMLARRIVARMIASEARVNVRYLREGDDGSMRKLTTAAAKVIQMPVVYDETSDQTITTMRAKARQWLKKYGIKLVLVDYLHLISAAGNEDNREQEVASFAKGLKAMAKELGVPVIALSQLNDEGKLRESRVISQTADVICRLEEDGEEEELHVQPILARVTKCRDGSTGDVKLIFRKAFTRFESCARIDQSDVPQTAKQETERPEYEHPYAD